ncbi:MAG TPA: hypothetical protein VLM44_11840, partial [Lutibacter sp.]|nr:hypothetical protein [Lutibacter sp.]
MLKTVISFLLSFAFIAMSAQEVMTPEKLLQLNKVSGKGLTKDGNSLIYSISKYALEKNSSVTTTYQMPIAGGNSQVITDYSALIADNSVSPDGKYKILTAEVKLKNVTGLDFYPDATDSNVQIYDELNYRHWDTWEDGAYSHIMYKSTSENDAEPIDIMAAEPFDSPQKPFGGSEDYLWSPDSKNILYVSKKLSGAAYAASTNTDIYQYNLETKTTTNLTSENKGYDTDPAFSSKGHLAWLQMKRDGYESDKKDIIVSVNGDYINLTANWDGTVDSFVWQDKGDKIYFVAPVLGTVQLFEIGIPVAGKKSSSLKQITNGQFDVHSIVGQSKQTIVVSRRDMNHAPELYAVN